MDHGTSFIVHIPASIDKDKIAISNPFDTERVTDSATERATQGATERTTERASERVSDLARKRTSE